MKSLCLPRPWHVGGHPQLPSESARQGLGGAPGRQHPPRGTPHGATLGEGQRGCGAPPRPSPPLSTQSLQGSRAVWTQVSVGVP